MKQGIPKSVQDALARQTPGDEHPSADLLNGYTEQSLTASDTARVTTHLAACKDCREIVFLASAAQEEEVVPAAPVAARQEQVGTAVAVRARSKWMWWKWAVPAVAVIAIVAGVLVERDRFVEQPHPANNTLALNQPASSSAPSVATAAPVVAPSAPPADKTSQAKPTESKKHTASAAQENNNVRRGQRMEEQQALQRSREMAQLPSSLEKARPSAGAALVGGPLPAAPRAYPTLSLVSGDFTGTVTDPSGAVVPNATVTLKNSSTGQTRTTTTNTSGAYRFSLLQPGRYTVSATASNFSKAETTAMITAGQATVADVKLAVGASSTAVEVTSAVPLVQADSADLSTNFDQNVVANSPSGGNDLNHIQKSAPAAAAKDEATSAASLKSGLMSSGQPGAANKLARAALPSTRWRITANGHLERALPGTAWTRVLVDQPVAFRAVDTIGANVWAGGNGGALFHSIDQGERWNKVALSVNGHAERSPVVSIHFDNAVQGSVRTESGTTWTTSDGGLSWNKQ